MHILLCSRLKDPLLQRSLLSYQVVTDLSLVLLKLIYLIRLLPVLQPAIYKRSDQFMLL